MLANSGGGRVHEGPCALHVLVAVLGGAGDDKVLTLGGGDVLRRHSGRNLLHGDGHNGDGDGGFYRTVGRSISGNELDPYIFKHICCSGAWRCAHKAPRSGHGAAVVCSSTGNLRQGRPYCCLNIIRLYSRGGFLCCGGVYRPHSRFIQRIEHGGGAVGCIPDHLAIMGNGLAVGQQTRGGLCAAYGTINGVSGIAKCAACVIPKEVAAVQAGRGQNRVGVSALAGRNLDGCGIFQAILGRIGKIDIAVAVAGTGTNSVISISGHITGGSFRQPAHRRTGRICASHSGDIQNNAVAAAVLGN